MNTNTSKKVGLLGCLLSLVVGSCKPQTAPGFVLNLSEQTVLPQEMVREIQFSPDGKKLLVLFGSSKDNRQAKTAYVWDAVHPENSVALKDSDLAIASAAWSPDGATIATGMLSSSERKGLVYFWNASSGERIPGMPDSNLSISGKDIVKVGRVFFSQDGGLLAMEWTDGLEKSGTAVWDVSLNSGKKSVLLVEAAQGVFYGDGFAAIEGGAAKVWGPSIAEAGGASRCPVAGEGPWGMCGAFKGKAKRLLPVSDKGLLVVLTGTEGDQLCFRSGGRLEVGSGECPAYGGEITSWSSSTDGTQVLMAQRSPEGVERLLFIPDASQPEKAIELEERRQGEQLMLSSAGNRYVHSLPQTSVDGRDAIGLSLKNPRNAQETVELDLWPNVTVLPWVFSSNGNRLAATFDGGEASSGRFVYVWDVKGL